MKGKKFARDSGRIITAKEIADAAGINTVTLFYNAKILRELLEKWTSMQHAMRQINLTNHMNGIWIGWGKRGLQKIDT